MHASTLASTSAKAASPSAPGRGTLSVRKRPAARVGRDEPRPGLAARRRAWADSDLRAQAGAGIRVLPVQRHTKHLHARCVRQPRVAVMSLTSRAWRARACGRHRVRALERVLHAVTVVHVQVEVQHAAVAL